MKFLKVTYTDPIAHCREDVGLYFIDDEAVVAIKADFNDGDMVTISHFERNEGPTGERTTVFVRVERIKRIEVMECVQ